MSGRQPGVTVSERARTGLDHFVAQAVKSALAPAGSGFPLSPADGTAAAEREVVMLTVSSYMFRMLLFIHFNRDAATRAYFAGLAGQPTEAMDDERFTDAVMERGNLCCGALNRDLALFFPHIGMSTPCILHRSSVDHIAAVQPSFSRRYHADAAPGVGLSFTIALCAFADLDFAFVPRTAQQQEQEEAAGELEMF